MTVSEAAASFARYPGILRGIEPLVAVGLSYLKLGQPVPTLRYPHKYDCIISQLDKNTVREPA